MCKSDGKHRWIIPDMYMPEHTTPGHYKSHESICVINTSDNDCEILLTLYYEDREPIQMKPVTCKARRTNHIRMDESFPEADLPKGVPYAASVESDIPIVVQYTRVDTTQEANALMTTMGYCQG